jgi:hypothetical protein
MMKKISSSQAGIRNISKHLLLIGALSIKALKNICQGKYDIYFIDYYLGLKRARPDEGILQIIGQPLILLTGMVATK